MAEVERIQILVNKKARRSWKKKARKLKADLGESAEFSYIQFPVEIPEDVSKVVAFGGDGTICAVANAIRPGGVVIAAPAGTENAFYKNLVQKEATVLPSQIKNTEDLGLLPFRPAMVNNVLFTIGAEIGAAATDLSKLNEATRRFIPRKIRLPVVAGLAVLKHAHKNSKEKKNTNEQNPIVSYYYLGSVFMSRDVFPEQNLFSKTDVTAGSIQAMSKGKFAYVAGRLFASLAFNRPIPKDLIRKGLMTQESGPYFSGSMNGNTEISQGGDRVPVEEDVFEVRRGKKEIFPAALVYSKARSKKRRKVMAR